MVSDTQHRVSSQSRAGWALWGGSAAPLFSADTGGSGVGLWCLVVLAPWTSPWTPSQQMEEFTCLCSRSFQQHSWNKTLLYVCIVLLQSLDIFWSQSMETWQTLTAQTPYLAVCAAHCISQFQETCDVWIVCVREGGYKHAQSFRVDVYKPSFLQHLILSLECLRDVFLASD